MLGPTGHPPPPDGALGTHTAIVGVTCVHAACSLQEAYSLSLKIWSGVLHCEQLEGGTEVVDMKVQDELVQ